MNSSTKKLHSYSSSPSSSSSCSTIIGLFLLIFVATINLSKEYELYKSKFNKLRHITLKDDAFCEAYQEYKDNNCIAKLTFCSPLTEQQTLRMRQILCGPKFNMEVQPAPHIQQPPEVNETDPFMIPEYPPPYFLDVHPAQPNSFPWLAAIYNSERKFLCAGALVAPKTVITSAQCVSTGTSTENEGNAAEDGGNGDGDDGTSEEQRQRQQQQQQQSANFLVRFGRHNLNVSTVYDKAYEYDVESIEISPQFDSRSLENDFAILKLVSPVCNFAPIPLPKRDDWENGHYFGNHASVLYAGWGLGHYQKPYLRSLSSHLIPKDACAKKFNWAPDQLSNSHLCVSPPINVCVGGMGTPLVAHTPHHYVLLGILSLGDHCNTPKLPLIFTKVSTFIDEIERFIDEDFKSMNGTIPYEDCLRFKHFHPHQPYYFYPPYQYKYYDEEKDDVYPKSHTQY